MSSEGHLVSRSENSYRKKCVVPRKFAFIEQNESGFREIHFSGEFLHVSFREISGVPHYRESISRILLVRENVHDVKGN